MRKILLSLLTAMLLMGQINNAYAFSGNSRFNRNDSIENTSSSDTITTDGEIYINPVYEDVIDEDDIEVPETDANDGISVASDDETIVYSNSIEEVAAELRAGMKARESTIVVYYSGETYSSDYFTELCTQYIIPEALAETEYADEGDYLRYNYGGTGYRAAITADSDGNYRNYTITFTPTYFTTAAQETTVSEKVDSLLENEFAFATDVADYLKIYTVYNYICNHVTYDNDSTTTIKYTAYAALINGTAVCQGYATLYYRLLRELGIGVRVATGYGGVESDDTSNYYENHAWNIVELDNKWFYADSTWDTSYKDEAASKTYFYQYFLKGTTDFDTLDAPYTTTGLHYLIMDDDFLETYPVEDTKYVLSEEECESYDIGHIYITTSTATCNDYGTITHTCAICGYSYSEAGTSYDNHSYEAVITEPTCTECGYTTYTCSVCGDSYIADETDALGHTWDEGVVTVAATTTSTGIKTYTCSECGETYTEEIPKIVSSTPSVSLSVSQNNGKIKLTGVMVEGSDYEITSHGFVYITKAVLGAKSLSVNTSGRTKVTVSGNNSDGSYAYSMIPKSSSTVYVIRAFVTYKNSSGKTVYVYSDPIYTSYDAIN